MMVHEYREGFRRGRDDAAHGVDATAEVQAEWRSRGLEPEESDYCRGYGDGQVSYDTTACQYYLLCTNKAVGTTRHPVIGDVQTCQRCAAKHGLTIAPYTEVVGG